MTSRRLLKAAEAIREVVASSILTELRDPRVQDVTVVSVTVSPDMREAKVAVSVMGSEKQQQLSLRGLQNAAGFLQSRIASRIETRHTPKLQFKIDKGIQNSLAVGEILARIEQERSARSTGTDSSHDDSGETVDPLATSQGSQSEPHGSEHPGEQASGDAEDPHISPDRPSSDPPDRSLGDQTP